MPTALVTGPTSGLGHAFARALAARGFDLVLVSRAEERLTELAADLTNQHGVATEVLVADLADDSAVERVTTRLADPDAGVDMLVNNAGFGLGRRFQDSTIEDEQGLVDVHIRAVLRLTKAAVPGMVQRGHGWVINIGSVAGFVPYGSYGAAKAWVTSFTEGLAAELTGTGVRAVVCCPGYVRTEFHQRADIRGLGGLPGFMWLNAEDVVAETLRGLSRSSPTIVPSPQYRAIVALARYAPRRLVAAVTRRVGDQARTGRPR